MAAARVVLKLYTRALVLTVYTGAFDCVPKKKYGVCLTVLDCFLPYFCNVFYCMYSWCIFAVFLDAHFVPHFCIIFYRVSAQIPTLPGMQLLHYHWTCEPASSAVARGSTGPGFDSHWERILGRRIKNNPLVCPISKPRCRCVWVRHEIWGFSRPVWEDLLLSNSTGFFFAPQA